MRCFTILALAVGLMFVATGCGGTVEAATYPTGKPCIVQLKRDLAGLFDSSPVGVQATNHAFYVKGTLDAPAGEYLVVLQDNGKQVWIPKEVVLLIEVTEAEAAQR